jgi:phage protein D
VATGVIVKFTVAGKEIPAGHVVSFSVERDMYQPDMAVIVLSNQDNTYSGTEVASAVELLVGDKPTSIYKGEIVGLEPVFKGGAKATITIRAMNKLHRLLRKRKSVTFADKTDQQILTQVVGDAGLSLEWKHSKTITYKHVYQHNQTDLEFLRTRAARLGCHVWCVDTKVFCKEPDLQNDSKIKLTVDPSSEGAQLRAFSPRLSSAAIVNKVTVKGWNPETKELISGDATSKKSPLGKETAVTGSKALGTEETFTVDHPIWAKDEAIALAAGRLSDLSLSYITGEAEVIGNPDFDLGQVITITVGKDDPFTGMYYVMGLSHRFTASNPDGFISVLKLARDAQKG